MPRGQTVCDQHSEVYGCPCSSQAGTSAPVHSIPLMASEGERLEAPQARQPSLHMLSLPRCTARDTQLSPLLPVFQGSPSSPQEANFIPSHLWYSLCLPTLLQRLNILQSKLQTSFLSRETQQRAGAGVGVEGSFFLLTVHDVPGEDGEPGTQSLSCTEETGNEFLLKSFIPAGESHPGHISVLQIAATEQAPAGMSSPGCGLMG